MNDSDLEAKLRSVPLPERPDDYWDDFPGRVRMQLHRERPEPASRQAWRPRLGWAGGLALASVLAFVCIQYHPLQTASATITKDERNLRRQLAQLDTGLHVLMLNPHGMGYLLAEAN